MFEFFNSCDHDWEVVKDETLKSPLEVAKEQGAYRGEDLAPWVFEQKKIVILKCKRCGELDKTIESNIT